MKLKTKWLLLADGGSDVPSAVPFVSSALRDYEKDISMMCSVKNFEVNAVLTSFSFASCMTVEQDASIEQG